MAVAAVFESCDAENVLQVVLMFRDRTELLVKNGLGRMDHINRVRDHLKSSDQEPAPQVHSTIRNDHDCLIWL